MIRRRRWHQAVVLVVVLLVFGAAGPSAGGQATEDQTALIARQQALIIEQQDLIEVQESLLTNYRCRFGVDLELVPDGCPDQAEPTPSSTEAANPASEADATPQDQAGDLGLPSPTIAEQWEQLRQCTSGGDYQFSNPNGVNFGAYEFRQITWDELARRHYPHLVGVNPRDADPADQDRMAYRLYEERGWKPWPECGAFLHLLLLEGSTPADSTQFPAAPEGTTQEQWDQLIHCESRGNYQAYSSVGPFLGAFQFLQSTWDWVAGIHYPRLEGVDPRNATPADQHRMAYALYRMQGWRPWPVCGAPFS